MAITYVHVFRLYDMTMLSFVLAFLHFITELLAFQTCELGVGAVSPLVVSGVYHVYDNLLILPALLTTQVSFCYSTISVILLSVIMIPALTYTK